MLPATSHAVVINGERMLSTFLFCFGDCRSSGEGRISQFPIVVLEIPIVVLEITDDYGRDGRGLVFRNFLCGSVRPSSP